MMPLQNFEQKYTYQDYLTWDDDERWEIIDGIPYNMSPAPRRSHQDVVANLSGLIKNLLPNKTCRMYLAPTDVVLGESDVVQPDVFVVCDPKKLTERGIKGAPDVVFEILSPSTERKDRWIKKRRYEMYGVKEYIIIDIDAQYAEQFVLQENGEFNKGEEFGINDVLKIQALDHIELPMQAVLDIPISVEEPGAAN